MKQLIVYLFFALSCTSQNFKFNIVTNYEKNMEGRKNERLILSNKYDQTYFLNIDGTEATLSDLKRKKYHHFKLKKNKGNSAMPFRFIFLNSTDIQTVELTKDYKYTFETISEDSIYKKIRMVSNKSDVNKKGYTELIAKKYPQNLFPTFRYSYMHLFETRMDVDIKENVLIMSSKWIGEKNYECNLKSIDEVEIEINVS